MDVSPIHGKGLFARHHIKAGEIIGVIDGIPASTNGEHVLWLDGKNGIHHCCPVNITEALDKVLIQ